MPFSSTCTTSPSRSTGTGEARCGGDDRAVGPGDVMFVPPGAPHSLIATGAGELRFVVVTSPPDDIAR